MNVFTKLTEGQSEYQKQYLILANYMTAIRKMVLDTSDLPKKYHDDAQSCFDEIQKVVSRYSYSIGNQLKDIPENMLTSLTEITECFNEAIPAATRLSNQQGIDGDILAVKKAIRKSLNFVDNSIDDCITIIDNINKFCNGGGIDGKCQFVGVIHIPLILDGIEHGGALVYQQLAAQIGLFLKLLDEEFVGAGIESPVQVACALACVVLPIVGEFSREPVERTPVTACDKTLDHLPCKEVEGLVAGNLALVHDSFWGVKGIESV